MDTTYKEVRFDIYCDICVNKTLPESQSPCNECLEEGMNEGTEKPVCFKDCTLS